MGLREHRFHQASLVRTGGAIDGIKNVIHAIIATRAEHLLRLFRTTQSIEGKRTGDSVCLKCEC